MGNGFPHGKFFEVILPCHVEAIFVIICFGVFAGRVGSAAAIHLLRSATGDSPSIHVILAGRGEKLGQAAQAEVLADIA